VIEESLYAFITTNSSIIAALGSTRSDKTSGVFPDIAPDECLTPYVVYMQVSGEPLAESFQGTGALQTARYRFACSGATKKQAKNLANVLKLALLSMDGPQAIGGVEIHGAWLRLEADTVEPMLVGTIKTTHIDFDFNYLDTE
jgi:hypothetical protein